MDAAVDAATGHHDDAATWVRTCTGSGVWTTDFDSLPAWARTWYSPSTSTATAGVSAGALWLRPTTVHDHYAGISSPTGSLRDLAISIELDQVTNEATTFLGFDALPQGYVRISYVTGRLRFHESNAGPQPIVTFDQVQHRFWQLRSQDDMIYFETSADGQTFVVQHARPAPAFLDAAMVALGAGSHLDGTLDPGVSLITRLDHCLL